MRPQHRPSGKGERRGGCVLDGWLSASIELETRIRLSRYHTQVLWDRSVGAFSFHIPASGSGGVGKVGIWRLGQTLIRPPVGV